MTERNNQNRFDAPNPDEVPNTPSHAQNIQVPQQQPAPVNMQFSVPTEFVDLPSKGRYYPQGHPLCGKESVEIRYMTAKEEDILASATLIRRGVVFDRLIQSVMVDRIDPNDLLVGDKNALLIAARITGYGPEYQTEVRCPSCSQKSNFMFDLSQADISMQEKESNKKVFEVEQTNNGTFVFNLVSMNCAVEVKLLNGHDEKKLSFVSNAKNKNNLVESLITDTLKAYIVSVNGDSSRATVNQFVDTLPASASRTIRNMYKLIIPKVSVESQYSCANCGHEEHLEVPLNADFFWPNE